MTAYLEAENGSNVTSGQLPSASISAFDDLMRSKHDHKLAVGMDFILSALMDLKEQKRRSIRAESDRARRRNALRGTYGFENVR